VAFQKHFTGTSLAVRQQSLVQFSLFRSLPFQKSSPVHFRIATEMASDNESMAGPSKDDQPLEDKEKRGLQLPKSKRNASLKRNVPVPVVRHATVTATEVSDFSPDFHWHFASDSTVIC
jgi:hypothetical protein